MRRLLVALLLLALVGLAVWMLHDPGPAPEPIAPGGVQAAPGSNEGSDVSKAVGQEALAEARPAAKVSARTELGGAAATRDDQVEIRLVTRDGGVPLPDAEAFWLPDFDARKLSPEESQEHKAMHRDQEKITRRFGQRFLPDREGALHLPRPRRSATLTARSGELYGEYAWDPEDKPPYLLELEKDTTLRVLVVKAQGEPEEGVEVDLFYDVTFVPTPLRLPIAVTNANGQVRVRHLQRKRCSFGGKWKGLTVGPRLPGIEIKPVPLDLTHPPQEALRFVLPATCRVVLRIRDVDPFMREGDASLTPYVGSPPRPSSAFASRFRTHGQQGVFTFPRVGLGKRFEAVAWLAGHNATERRDLTTPRVAGATVTLDLAMESRPSMLVGRLVEPSGAPVAGAKLKGFLLASDSDYWRSYLGEFQTGADGSFTVVVPSWARGHTMRGARFVELEDNRPAGRVARFTGRLQPGPGTIDLGSLILAEPPLVVGGRVTFAPEKPSYPIRFQVQQQEQNGEPRGKRWQGLHDLTALYEEKEGRFRVLGQIAPGPLRLAVTSYQFLPLEPIPFSRGRRDLKVHLVKGGMVEARLLIDRDTASRLRGTLVPMPGTTPGKTRLEGVWGPDPARPRCRFTSLPPGRYVFSVRLQGEAEPLYEIKGLEVPAGAHARDARLDHIDLRGLLHRIVIEVRDSQGKPIALPPSGGVYLLPADASRGLEGFRIRRSEVTLVLRRPSADILVSVAGFVPRRLRHVTRDTVVQLEGPAAVRVVPAKPLSLPPGLELRLHLRGQPEASEKAQGFRLYGDIVQGTEGTGRLPEQRNVLVSHEADGSFVAKITLPGRYELAWSLARKAKGKRKQASIQGASPSTIDVPRVPGDLGFAVTFPPTALETAVSKLR